MLVQSGFMDGWPAPFYIFAVLSIVWLIIWAVFVENRPEQHQFISKQELQYITESTQKHLNSSTREVAPPPWRLILTSGPVWACIVGYFMVMWVWAFMITCLPLFINDVLKLTVMQVSCAYILFL